MSNSDVDEELFEEEVEQSESDADNDNADDNESKSTTKSSSKSTKASSKSTTSGAKRTADGAAKPVKKSTVSDREGKQLILDYMVQHNRPYGYLNIYDNLHEVVKKSSVQKLLEELTAEGKLQSKQYNKAIIYLPKQPEYKPEEQSNQLTELDTEIAELTTELTAQKETVTALTNQLNTAKSEPTDAELESSLTTAQTELKLKQNKLKEFTNQSSNSKKPLTAAEINTIQSQFNDYCSEWKNRRRGCLELADSFLEHLSVKPNKFYSDRGLELDEDQTPPINIKDYLTMMVKVDKPVKGSAANSSKAKGKK